MVFRRICGKKKKGLGIRRIISSENEQQQEEFVVKEMGEDGEEGRWSWKVLTVMVIRIPDFILDISPSPPV